MKKFLSLLLMGSLVIGLAGCVNIEPEEEAIDCVKYPTHKDCVVEEEVPEGEAPGIIEVLDALPSEDIVITFWHVYGQGKEALLLDYIAEFEALYPNITVEASSQGGYDDLRNKTILSISAGATPTMLVGYPDHVAGYLNGSAVIPLDDFILDETFGIDLSDFITSYVEENQQYEGGLMYSLPYSKSTEMMVINKTKFEAMGITVPTDRPLTFDELETYALTMVGDGANQCEYLLNYDSSANMFINNIRMWDGGYTNSAGDILVDNANTKAMLTAASAYFQNKTIALPIAWNQQYGSTNFLAGDSCMTIGSTAGISYNVPTDGSFEILVAPVPQWDEDHMSAVQQGPNIAIMSNSTPAERLAAWLFIKYITDSEQTAQWSMLTGYLPVRYSGYDSAEYQAFLNDPDPDYIYESMTANAAFLQVDYFEFDPAFAGRTTSSDARVQAGIVMEAIFTGNVSIDAAIEDMMYQLGAN